MCSIVEEDFGDDGGAHAMIEDVKTNGETDDVCKKCNMKSTPIILTKCETCFIASVRHKFRASLGCTKVVRRGSNVLLHFNASQESVCLLDMIKFAFEQESHKRLCFDLELVYVDENCVCKDSDLNTEKRLSKIKIVNDILAQFPNFKCYYSSIAGSSNDLVLIRDVSTQLMQSVIAEEAKMLSTFNSLESLTSKQDFLAMMRNEVLRQAATSLKCQYVFAPEISITLANRLLTNISLGRGSSAAFDVAFCDDRIESLKFVRPIKDLSVEEVSNYLRIENLKFIEVTNYGDNYGQFASIQNLTSQFIHGLQQNFSSTVSTVYRTCGKIAPKTEALPVNIEHDSKFLRNLTVDKLNQRCVMCKTFLDHQNSETLYAINFSRFVSETAGNHNNQDNMEQVEVDLKERIHADEAGKKKNLCHGCRNIFIGFDDQELEQIF